MMDDERQRLAQMDMAFCSTNPELTKLPHCIFRNYHGAAGAIADMIDTPVGVWGDRCFVDAEGEPYLEPEDGRVIEDFQLWSLPINQVHARRFAGKSTGFTMVIPANTSHEVLRKTYELANVDDQVFGYDTYVTKIAKLIPEIGWAYIPLEYENDYAIFVASHENRHLVHEFRRRLEQAGVSPIFDVSTTASGQRWNGPILWESE